MKKRRKKIKYKKKHEENEKKYYNFCNKTEKNKLKENERTNESVASLFSEHAHMKCVHTAAVDILKHTTKKNKIHAQKK